MRTQIEGLLERRTGEGIEAWNRRVAGSGAADEAALRAWLTDNGVTGYPQMLLVMERFGYPDYLLAQADELIEGQYADRPQLRPVLDAVLAVASTLGEVSVQARKTYISLVGPRRTFAAVKATTRNRVDLGLRLDGVPPSGRLEAARGVGTDALKLRIGLNSPDDLDDEAIGWFRRAYDANA